MTIKHCIKCHQYDNEDSMCLGLHDIIENYVSDNTINEFQKKYLNNYSIENWFCSHCASLSLSIMEGKKGETR